MKDEDIIAAESEHRPGFDPGLVTPFNARHHGAKKAPKKRSEHEQAPVKRVDMEMYTRPQPDIFSQDWEDGYKAGQDNETFEVRNLNYAQGYAAGVADAAEEKAEMDRTGSSNA